MSGSVMPGSGIANEVVIAGPPEKVFDVLTIARLWPQWHVLTRAVAGVIETPFQMGDRMYEFVRTPSGPYEFEWQIVELDRPRRAKLQAEDGTAITYTFEARADGTLFRRVFEVGSVFGNQKPVAVTKDTELRSVQNLKALVENIIWREQKGRYVR
jgi:uncharacterized protein YndB with AHSA1/START domain